LIARRGLAVPASARAIRPRESAGTLPRKAARSCCSLSCASAPVIFPLPTVRCDRQPDLLRQADFSVVAINARYLVQAGFPDVPTCVSGGNTPSPDSSRRAGTALRWSALSSALMRFSSVFISVFLPAQQCAALAHRPPQSWVRARPSPDSRQCFAAHARYRSTHWPSLGGTE